MKRWLSYRSDDTKICEIVKETYESRPTSPLSFEQNWIGPTIVREGDEIDINNLLSKLISSIDIQLDGSWKIFWVHNISRDCSSIPPIVCKNLSSKNKKNILMTMAMRCCWILSRRSYRKVNLAFKISKRPPPKPPMRLSKIAVWSANEGVFCASKTCFWNAPY